MDKLKEKLFGLIVVIALGIIFIPMFFHNGAEQQTNLAENSPSSNHVKEEEKKFKKPPVLAQLKQSENDEYEGTSSKNHEMPHEQEIELVVNSAELAASAGVKHEEKNNLSSDLNTAPVERSNKSSLQAHKAPGIAFKGSAPEEEPAPVEVKEEKSQPEAMREIAQPESVKPATELEEPSAQSQAAIKIVDHSEKSPQQKEPVSKKKEIEIAQAKPAQELEQPEKKSSSYTLPLHRPLEDEPAQSQMLAQADTPPLADSAQPAEALSKEESIVPTEPFVNEVIEKPATYPDAGVQSIRKEISKSKTPKSQKAPIERVAPDQAGWVIQMGAFAYHEHAVRLTNKLKSAGYPAYMRRVNRDGRTLTLVFVGPQARKDEAIRTQAILENKYKLKTLIVHYKPA